MITALESTIPQKCYVTDYQHVNAQVHNNKNDIAVKVAATERVPLNYAAVNRILMTVVRCETLSHMSIGCSSWFSSLQKHSTAGRCTVSWLTLTICISIIPCTHKVNGTSYTRLQIQINVNQVWNQ